MEAFRWLVLLLSMSEMTGCWGFTSPVWTVRSASHLKATSVDDLATKFFTNLGESQMRDALDLVRAYERALGEARGQVDVARKEAELAVARKEAELAGRLGAAEMAVEVAVARKEAELAGRLGAAEMAAQVATSKTQAELEVVRSFLRDVQRDRADAWETYLKARSAFNVRGLLELWEGRLRRMGFRGDRVQLWESFFMSDSPDARAVLDCYFNETSQKGYRNLTAKGSVDERASRDKEFRARRLGQQMAEYFDTLDSEHHPVISHSTEIVIMVGHRVTDKAGLMAKCLTLQLGLKPYVRCVGDPLAPPMGEVSQMAAYKQDYMLDPDSALAKEFEDMKGDVLSAKRT